MYFPCFSNAEAKSVYTGKSFSIMSHVYDMKKILIPSSLAASSCGNISTLSNFFTWHWPFSLRPSALKSNENEAEQVRGLNLFQHKREHAYCDYVYI